MTDIQQEAGMCARCWGKAFTAAYGIGSKTQAGEYERIVASCACTPAQRYGVADSFAAGYTARDKEMRQLRLLAEDQLTTLRKLKAEMLSDTRDKEIEELRAELADWRESAKKAAGETCGDEQHCACVGSLRARVKELEGMVKFRDDFMRERYIQAFTDCFPPIPLPGNNNNKGDL